MGAGTGIGCNIMDLGLKFVWFMMSGLGALSTRRRRFASGGAAFDFQHRPSP